MKKVVIFCLLLLLCATFFVSSRPESLRRVIQDETEWLKSLRKTFEAFQDIVRDEVLYVQTDKTLYVPGETLWFSVFVRDEKNLLPSTQSDIVHAELISPKGDVAQRLRIIARDGVAPGDFPLSAELPGGIYTLRVSTRWQKNNPLAVVCERKITVQQLIATRLLFTLDFTRRAYGPGDPVQADVLVKTAEGLPFRHKTLSFIVQTEGAEWMRSTTQTNDSGKAVITFTLPATLSRADGLLTVLATYDGVQESVVRNIPLLLQDMQVQFFPEGGDWIIGQKSNIAFRAVNGFGKAADLEGVIEDEQGKAIQMVSSYHFGMGSFELKPDSGKRYALRVTRPEGITGRFYLPAPIRRGYSMHMKVEKNQLQLKIYSPFHETLQLMGQVRGQVVLSKGLRLPPGVFQCTIDVSGFPQGVGQFTLFDSKGMERAERLVFFGRDKGMNISLETDKPQYLPREKVTLHIRTTDGDGLPLSADLALSVTDQGWLRMADDRQASLMPAIFLQPYLNEMPEEADVYFDAKNPKSEQAMDLLMLTAGWRKYAWNAIRAGNPEIVHPAEKAVFSGVVRAGESGKPIAGAVLRFTETGIRTESDVNGAFTFSRVDLSVNKTLEIKAGNFAPVTVEVSEYQTEYPVYLYSHQIISNTIVGRRGLRAGARDKMEDALIPQAADFLMENMAMEQLAVAEDVREKKAEANGGVDILHEQPEQPMIPGRLLPVPIEPPVIGYYKQKVFPVKIYKTTQVDSVRDDYRRTIYWNGQLKTDAYGKAKVVFSAGDLLSSWRILAEGFGQSGQPGQATLDISTQLPVSVESKVPEALTTGDKLDIPVIVKNNSLRDQRINIRAEFPTCLSSSYSTQSLQLAAGTAQTIYISAVATKADTGVLQLFAEGAGIRESFSSRLHVSPRGFPVTRSFSGQALSQEFRFRPEQVVPGSLQLQFTAYPNLLTQLMSGVESILREPYGCFEQTSSSNYPNIIALDYLRVTGQANPALEARCNALLDNGYKKLISFETKENGYEWFGAAPAHEALTAYGLMEFVDMKKVYPGVDEAMIGRTRKLLLDRRDGQGGFKRNPQALDAFGAADEEITNAYIVYSLSESGERDIEKELRAVVKNVKESRDPYTLALATIACFNLDDRRTAMELIELLHKTQYDGFWTGRKHSITRSTGKSLHVETTALVLMALLRADPPRIDDIDRAVKFLMASNTGYGGFGSTQATILALKALTRFTLFSKKTEESGVIEVYVNGVKRAEKAYEKGQTGEIAIDGLAAFVGKGEQQLQVKFKGCKQGLPFAVALRWHTTLPEDHPEAVVRLDMKMMNSSTRVGETNRLTIEVSNTTQQGQPMTLAQIALPAGMSLSPQQLRQFQEEKQFDFYELNANQLALYWRALAPAEKRSVSFDLKAELPGTYEAQASSVCLYYTPEKKVWRNTAAVRLLP